jgi:hypothetical protein
MNPIIKDFEQKISEASTIIQKEEIATHLHRYLATLPQVEQHQYAQNLKASIHRKMVAIDKLIESYEIMKEDLLVQAV